MKWIAPLLGLALMSACAAPPAPDAEGAPPDPIALGGTSWVLQDADAPANARLPTIDFSPENRASGFSGCNQWFAQTNMDNGGLRFAAVGMTRRACPEPAMTIERDFGAVLEQARSAQFEGDDLIFFGPEAEEIARFTPAR